VPAGLQRGRPRAHRGAVGARSRCRLVLPLIHFIPYSLIYSVPLFLKRQCDRTLGALRQRRQEERPRGLIHSYPMSITPSECQVSELVNSDTCPRPTTGRRAAPGGARGHVRGDEGER
jgi:hypothetical protein